jgi:hypothetical protein
MGNGERTLRSAREEASRLVNMLLEAHPDSPIVTPLDAIHPKPDEPATEAEKQGGVIAQKNLARHDPPQG